MSNLNPRFIRGLLVALLLAAASPGAAGTDPTTGGSVSYQLSNSHMDAVFEQFGTHVELASILNKDLVTPRPMLMAEESGSWRLRFVNDGTFEVKDKDCLEGADCNPSSSDEEPCPTQWFDVTWDGLVDWNASWLDPDRDPPPATVVVNQPVKLPSSSNQLVFQWNGTIQPLGSMAAVELTVTLRWRLVSVQASLDTVISVVLDDDPLDPPFYLSEVIYPEVRIRSLQGETGLDALAIPWLGGSLISRPTDAGVRVTASGDMRPCFPFPTFLGSGTNHFPMELAAYYDGMPSDSNCLAMMTTDYGDYWKELLVGVGPNLGQGDCISITDFFSGECVDCSVPNPDPNRWVRMAIRHVPENLFDDQDFVHLQSGKGYEVRLAAIAGDWWDVAEAYQDLLETQAVNGEPITWYQGPVGSDDNAMPAAAKDLASQVLFVPGLLDDHMDMQARQTLDLTRVLGSNASCIYYGGHAPDRFELWYYGDGQGNTGYLPGKPSLVSAVKEAQKQFQHVASLYWNSSKAVDCGDPKVADCSLGLLTQAKGAALVNEDLDPQYKCQGSPRQLVLDSAAAWWQDQSIADLTEIVEFTGMKGVYLDFLVRGPCYASDHLHTSANGLANTGPGGGNYMQTARVAQIKGLQDSLDDKGIAPLVVTMEAALDRLGSTVHVMNADPTGARLSAEDWTSQDPGSPNKGLLCPGVGPDGKPAPTAERPMANAAAIPFFRAIFDNVKMGRIASVEGPTDPGRRSWVHATAVLTFGQIPSVVREHYELIPLFSNRYAFAQNFLFLGAGPYGTSASCGQKGVTSPCGVGDTNDCNFNGVADQCDIKEGTSQDCNVNGIPDECEPDCNANNIADSCDIATGTSEDCDGNGVPDECQPDCNLNDVADVCDILLGTSLDCNDNGIPDECEVDCNFNEVPDDCDIAAGTSEDADGNGVPDECDPKPLSATGEQPTVALAPTGAFSSTAALVDDDPVGGPPANACDDAFNAPFYRFLKGLSAILHDGVFLTWHNGTIRRLPEFSVSTTTPNHYGVPGMEEDQESAFQLFTPIYTELKACDGTYDLRSYLVPGMFQAPVDAPGIIEEDQSVGEGAPMMWQDADSLAFIVANPWVNPDDPGIYSLNSFTFDPSKYPGWATGTHYGIHKYKLGELAPELVAADVSNTVAVPGPTLQPGDIVWWVFRKVAAP